MRDSVDQPRTAPSHRVLVVDDDQLLADTTTAILRHAGFEAAVAYDGYTALDLVKSFHPDCMLADILMPAMSGVELAMSVARHYPLTKIVLFSGQGGVSDILARSKALGFTFALLVKPVHPSVLIESLKKP